MKNILILVLASMMSLATNADDYTYHYLIFANQEGTEKSLAVNNLKITFANGQMLVDNGVESQTYDISSLSKMFFSENAVDGIAETRIDANEEVEVYTISGIGMGKYKNVNDAKQSLAKGVYVLKQGKTTSNIAIK